MSNRINIIFFLFFFIIYGEVKSIDFDLNFYLDNYIKSSENTVLNSYQNKLLLDQINALKSELYPRLIIDSTVNLNINDYNNNHNLKIFNISNYNRLQIVQKTPFFSSFKTYIDYNNNFSDFENIQIQSRIDQSFTFEYSQQLFFSKISFFELLKSQIQNIKTNIQSNNNKIYNREVISFLQILTDTIYYKKLLEKIEVDQLYFQSLQTKEQISKELGIIENYAYTNDLNISKIYHEMVKSNYTKILEKLPIDVEQINLFSVERLLFKIIENINESNLFVNTNYSIQDYIYQTNNYPSISFGIKYTPEKDYSFNNETYFESLNYKFNKFDVFFNFNLTSFTFSNDLKNRVQIEKLNKKIVDKKLKENFVLLKNEIIFLLNSYILDIQKIKSISLRNNAMLESYKLGKITKIEFLESQLSIYESVLNNIEKVKKILTKLSEIVEMINNKII